MPPAKTVELEEKVERLEKELSEMQEAFRRLSAQNRETLSSVSKTNEALSEFKTEVFRKLRDLSDERHGGGGGSW